MSLLNLRVWPREGIQENPLIIFVFAFLSLFLFIFVFLGELIFSEDPLVKGPNHTLTTPHCLECLKVKKSFKQLAHKLCRDLRPISHNRQVVSNPTPYTSCSGGEGRLRLRLLRLASVQPGVRQGA